MFFLENNTCFGDICEGSLTYSFGARNSLICLNNKNVIFSSAKVPDENSSKFSSISMLKIPYFSNTFHELEAIFSELFGEQKVCFSDFCSSSAMESGSTTIARMWFTFIDTPFGIHKKDVKNTRFLRKIMFFWPHLVSDSGPFQSGLCLPHALTPPTRLLYCKELNWCYIR